MPCQFLASTKNDWKGNLVTKHILSVDCNLKETFKEKEIGYKKL